MLLVSVGGHSAEFEEESEGTEFVEALGFIPGLCRRATAARTLRACTWKYMDLEKTQSRLINYTLGQGGVLFRAATSK